jgi:bifunctional NMN adenylyltransferase/nudix hydrolase
VKTLLYIGRFQPFHNGHLRAATQAQLFCDKLIIGLGSANAKPSPRNPFSIGERREMISTSLNTNISQIDFIHLSDFPNENDYWVRQVKMEMSRYGPDWGVFGFNKDASSFYLNLFPGHPLMQYNGIVPKIDGTAIRKMFFALDENLKPSADLEEIAKYVPQGTLSVLERIRNNDTERWELACKGAYL